MRVLEGSAWGVVLFLTLLQLARFISCSRHGAIFAGDAIGPASIPNTTLASRHEGTSGETIKRNQDARNYPFKTLTSSLNTDNASELTHEEPLLRVFVYEDLPAKLTTDVETCQLGEGVQGVWKKRNNFMADVPIINLFKSYQGRTWDPSEADIFVVPYPHKSHCICNLNRQGPRKPGLHCPQVLDDDIDLLVSSLLFLNTTTKNRHLFILSGDFGWSNLRLEMMPLILTLGPKPENRPGAIVIPYLNDRAEFQPSVIEARSDEWWTTRPRKYSFAYFFGGAEIRKIRGNFRRLVHAEYNNTLGNLPFVMKSISQWTPAEQDFVYKTYRQSIFCPCLAGDNAPQKRFFDVAMSGCLPVVLAYNQSRHPDRHSWFRRGGPSVRASYPFYNGNSNVGAHVDIDYESFVVQVPDNITNIKAILEGILSDPKDLRRRQENLRKYASLFSYGTTSGDSHTYRDAFSGIVTSLTEYHRGLKIDPFTVASSDQAKKSLSNAQNAGARPHLSNHLLSRFIVVPEYKLLFCYMEKVGCSMFNHLFRMLRIHRPEVANNPEELMRQASHTWMRNTPRSHNISKQQLELLMIDPSWTKAAFYRDPVTRFLSAFRSKCESGHDHLFFCEMVFGNRSMSFDEALVRVRQDKLHRNAHTTPMSNFCGGIGSTINHYDFVRELDPKTSQKHVTTLLDKIGVDQELTEELVGRIVRSGGTDIAEDEDFVATLGAKLKHTASQTPSHNTGSSKISVCDYYRTADNVKMIEDFYAVDYDTFQFATSQHNCSFCAMPPC